MRSEFIHDAQQNNTRRIFVFHLRRALRHLYDPIELRKNPLLVLFGFSGDGAIVAMRQTLEAAIRSMKPPAGLSPQSDAWRAYRALYHRYIEQFDQVSVAANLGLSVRQLRRQEQSAIQTLADRLVEQYSLDLESAFKESSFDETIAESDIGAPIGDSTSEGDALPDDIADELKWAERAFPSQVIALDEIVRSAVHTMQPMLQQAGIAIDCNLAGKVGGDLPRALGPFVSVRQATLNLLIAAVRSTTGQVVRVECGSSESEVWIDVQPITPTGDAGEALTAAQRLATLAGGRLECRTLENDVRAARLSLPKIEQLTVLAIDDNLDALHLFQRYLAGSRYALIGARDPLRGLALAEEIRPRVIVLDVMLPGLDGWELLGRLRENPATQRIPVVICTILPQEDLALTLGAAGFLRKPVSRERLLAVLDQQIEGAQEKAND
ncbi:MAG: response regulator [Anaerolineae bacterium]|nr:response regulator [Thermoflexales bacterium]MDW8406384.1 response regulator [Anaerolineae bacterium]